MRSVSLSYRPDLGSRPNACLRPRNASLSPSTARDFRVESSTGTMATRGLCMAIPWFRCPIEASQKAGAAGEPCSLLHAPIAMASCVTNFLQVCMRGVAVVYDPATSGACADACGVCVPQSAQSDTSSNFARLYNSFANIVHQRANRRARCVLLFRCRGARTACRAACPLARARERPHCCPAGVWRYAIRGRIQSCCFSHPPPTLEAPQPCPLIQVNGHALAFEPFAFVQSRNLLTLRLSAHMLLLLWLLLFLLPRCPFDRVLVRSLRRRAWIH